LNTVTSLIADQLGVTREMVKPGAQLERDLKADDLDRVELILALEDSFKIEIPDRAALAFRTVGDIVNYLTVQLGKPAEANQPPIRTSQPGWRTATLTERSGPRRSGVGAAFSPPYQVCATIPTGGVVTAVEFHLEGDRKCGDWSKCIETRNDKTSVCYEFMLQGHDETNPPRAAMSEGVLAITYRVPLK
jgi:acyl carrier protein